MLTKLLVVADDFTGALDTAVQFSKAGIAAKVYPKVQNLSFLEAEQVVVVNTNTRHLSAEQSFNLVHALTSQAKDSGVEFFYKKTDSALRGNIAAELSAMLLASGQRTLYYLPSYPKMNRITQDGILYIDGVKVSDSNFANDPFNPVTESFIPGIFTGPTDVEVYVVSNYDNLNDRPGIAIVDASTDEQLLAAARKLKAIKGKIYAGNAGFAEQIPQILSFSYSKPIDIIRSNHFCVISASLNEASLSQVEYAKSHDFDCLVFPDEYKAEPDFASSYGFSYLLKQISKRLKEEKPVILSSVENIDSVYDIPDVNPIQLAERISKNMGLIAAELISSTDATVLIIGGDLLYDTIDALAVSSVIPRTELLPGVAEFEVNLSSSRRQLISKSGGFGDREYIVEIYNEYLKDTV